LRRVATPPKGSRTEFVGSYAFSATERRTIARIAGATALEVRKHLPALAPQITLHAKRTDWIMQHPDGRRWIGMKTGTYLVDQAMKNLNRTSAELIAMPTADVLAAANAGR